MLYNRRLDGVGYDQWKLKESPYRESDLLECQDIACQACGTSIDPSEWDMKRDEMEPICIDCTHTTGE